MTNIYNRGKNSVLLNIALHYIITLFICVITAFWLSKNIWASHLNILHTVIEVICIFVALSSFFTVWNTSRYNSDGTKIIAFGLLSVAIFDSFHALYFPSLGLYPNNYIDLGTRFWILARLSEAFTILIVAFNIYNKNLNKWINLFATLCITFGLSYGILRFQNILPVLYQAEGVPLPKIILEYIIILLFGLSFYKLYSISKSHENNNFIAYKYICVSILLVITTEFLFTVFKTVTSFYNAAGHILKLSCYYYLFKGIFVNAVIYPYERLDEYNKRTSNLLNKLPVAVIGYNSSLKLEFANQKATDLTGYSQKEVVGLSAEEVTRYLYKDTPDQIEVLISRLNDQRPSITNIVRTITNRQGSKVKIIIDIHKLDSGEFIYLFNDAKQEQELINLQIQTYTILNALGSMVIVYDKLGKILMCNKAFETITGLYSGNVIDINMAQLYDKLKIVKIPLLKKFEGENSLSNPQFEATIISNSGFIKNLILQSSTILNIDGEVIGSVDIGTDISAFKEQQEKFLQQEKLALLGEMSAAVLHEAKNYLSTIKGSSQLMKIISSDDKIKSYSLKIDHATNEINNIINNYLSSGNLQPKNVVKTSLNEIISSLKAVLDNSSLINNIKISLLLNASNDIIECDKEQIKQVILNVCKNAVEAMSETKYPHLIIQTGNIDEANQLFIKVSDNGKGISKEEKSKVGSIFFTTKKFGSGLGLNICYKIINNHNGKIEIESEVGKGTIVCIILPAAAQENDNIRKIS